MSEEIIYAQMDSPVGPVWVASTEEGICGIGLGAGQPEGLLDWLSGQVGSQPPHENPAGLEGALAQLREYFAGRRRTFDVPLDVRGTDFQRAVWSEVARIPYGGMASYGEVARRVGKPGAARAVGAAVGANPLPILIPCHRVIGADGSLTGYGGGLDVKAALLRLEGASQR